MQAKEAVKVWRTLPQDQKDGREKHVEAGYDLPRKPVHSEPIFLHNKKI